MAVLVDEKTSGEAELFAVAIRDYNKGQIIGVKTAGKGTMQEIFPLTDGSAIEMCIRDRRYAVWSVTLQL